MTKLTPISRLKKLHPRYCTRKFKRPIRVNNEDKSHVFQGIETNKDRLILGNASYEAKVLSNEHCKNDRTIKLLLTTVRDNKTIVVGNMSIVCSNDAALADMLPNHNFRMELTNLEQPQSGREAARLLLEMYNVNRLLQEYARFLKQTQSEEEEVMSRIMNKKEINDFMCRHVRAGRTVYAVKGPAPKGATYSDGTPISVPVNVAWTEPETGERVDVVWCE